MLRTHWCTRLPYRVIEEYRPLKRKLKFSVMIETVLGIIKGYVTQP